jgi:catechol 2,3-dioxygenase-like lactoylglutathione lyase family enzyme
MSEYTIPAGATIGHVHLKVSDLDRAEAFYRDVLGFEVQTRYDGSASFLSAGGYHHHIGSTSGRAGGSPPPWDDRTLPPGGALPITGTKPAPSRLVETGVAIDEQRSRRDEGDHLRDRTLTASKLPTTGRGWWHGENSELPMVMQLHSSVANHALRA